MNSNLSLLVLAVMLQVALNVNAAWPRAFDIAQFVCTSPELELNELGVQFFEVNYVSHGSGQADLPDYKYLLVDVSSKDEHGPNKWCLFQVDLNPGAPKVLISWACEWDRILKMAREMIAMGNIDSVHNITTKMASRLQALDKYNLQMLRVMMGCEDYQVNASQELAQLDEQAQNTTESGVVTSCVNDTANVTSSQVVDITELDLGSTVSNTTEYHSPPQSIAIDSSPLVREKRHLNKTTTDAPLRNITKPLLIIIAIVIIVTIILLVYVYVFNGGPKKSSGDGSNADKHGATPKAKNTSVGSAFEGKIVKPDGGQGSGIKSSIKNGIKDLPKTMSQAEAANTIKSLAPTRLPSVKTQEFKTVKSNV